MKILRIDSSILGDHSISLQLTAAIVASLRQAHPAAEIVHRNLTDEPANHLTAAEFLAFQGTPPEGDLAKLQVSRNTQWLEEFLAADVVVLGAPMYNFTLPSQLKAWLDRLAVPGQTFAYSDKGVQGLAGGKRVIVASTRGGRYGEGEPAAPLDHQETYLRGFLGFLGITDITFIRAEGVGLSPAARDAAIKAALVEIDQLAA
ncbi:FMN-dependent NADH-azoreductase [Lysobacter sp. K5869]|uniref:FMN-dependent NADH-azoreductase n=1 Tax=Lysobacter sp. K5869 TaxID=2820808 RepID=UPI001C0641BD|nr:FMN-dependent NADH-azoreductase [Lysobacter sp. K5869]QWP75921.1 FMN-dependent NADH-azoreductase [Lysobacter sp. K5869]